MSVDSFYNRMRECRGRGELLFELFESEIGLLSSNASLALSFLVEWASSDRTKGEAVISRFFEEGRVFDFGQVSDEELFSGFEAGHGIGLKFPDLWILECIDRLQVLTPIRLAKLSRLVLESKSEYGTRMKLIIEKEVALRNNLLASEIFALRYVGLTGNDCDLFDKVMRLRSAESLDCEELVEDLGDAVTLLSSDLIFSLLKGVELNDSVLRHLAFAKQCPTSPNVLQFLGTKSFMLPALRRWARKQAESMGNKYLEISSQLPLVVWADSDAVFDRLGRRMTSMVSASPLPDFGRVAMDLEICSNHAGILKHLKGLWQWALNAFVPGKTQEGTVWSLGKVSYFARHEFPEISLARLHRQLGGAGGVGGSSILADPTILMAVAEAGGWGEELFEKTVETVLGEEISENRLARLSRVGAACLTALSAVGDLAWVGQAPEKFIVTGGFSEEQKMEWYERLRIRELGRAIKEEISMCIWNQLSITTLVEISWILGSGRISNKSIEVVFEEINKRVVSSTLVSGGLSLSGILSNGCFDRIDQLVQFVWSHAMVLRSLPNWFEERLALTPLRGLGDSDLLNLAVACIFSESADSFAFVGPELQSRGNLKSYQLPYQARAILLGKLHAVDSAAKSGMALVASYKAGGGGQGALGGKGSVRGKELPLARRAGWSQAMQVSLATHGVFGEGVEVAPSIWGLFPVDALVRTDGADICGLVVDLDRPLNFIRTLRGDVIRADSYVIASRQILSSGGPGNFFRIVNVPLADWLALPPGDIGAQINFVRDRLKIRRVVS